MKEDRVELAFRPASQQAISFLSRLQPAGQGSGARAPRGDLAHSWLAAGSSASLALHIYVSQTGAVSYEAYHSGTVQSSVLIILIALALAANIAQHRQRSPGSADIILSHAGKQFGVNFFSRRGLYGGSSLAALGKRHR